MVRNFSERLTKIQRNTGERIKKQSEILQKITSPDNGKKGAIQIRRMKCGKAKCKCKSGNPEDLHGPYKYELNNQRWKYLGKAEKPNTKFEDERVHEDPVYYHTEKGNIKRQEPENVGLKEMLTKLNNENKELVEELLEARKMLRESREELLKYEDKEICDILEKDWRARRDSLREN